MSSDLLVTGLGLHWDAVRSLTDPLRHALGRVTKPDETMLAEGALWMALALQFKPDVVLEIGRGRTHSTVAFALAAQQLGGCRVMSFGVESDKINLVKNASAPAAWENSLDLHQAASPRHDFFGHLALAKRPLVFWNAPGVDWADTMLGHIFPAIAGKPNAVICTDLWDARLSPATSGYANRPLWRGMEDFAMFRGREERAPLRLGWVSSPVDHAIALIDFCSRNEIELNSPTLALSQSPAIRAAIMQDYPNCAGLGAEGWCWLALDPDRKTYSFPALPIQGNRMSLRSDGKGPMAPPATATEALQRELDAARALASAHSLANAKLRQELREVYGSTSWRLTSFYRAAGSFAKSLGGSKGRSSDDPRSGSDLS